jgi:hypothetical protein
MCPWLHDWLCSKISTNNSKKEAKKRLEEFVWIYVNTWHVKFFIHVQIRYFQFIFNKFFTIVYEYVFIHLMELATKTTINCESIYNECVWVKQGTHDNHRLQTKTWIEENKFLPFENMKFLCRKSVFTRNFFIVYKGIWRRYVLFNDWQLKNQLRSLFQLLAEVREL